MHVFFKPSHPKFMIFHAKNGILKKVFICISYFIYTLSRGKLYFIWRKIIYTLFGNLAMATLKVVFGKCWYIHVCVLHTICACFEQIERNPQITLIKAALCMLRQGSLRYKGYKLPYQANDRSR